MSDLVESEDELLDPPAAPASGGRGRSGPSSGPGRLTAWTGRAGRLGPAWLTGPDGPARRLRARIAPGDGAEPDPRRRQRMVRAAALALALAAGAGAAGVAVHRVDLHRSQSRVQDRMLLHLLGGGASLTYAGVGARDGVSVPDSFDTPMATDFTIGLRNDGARPLEITGVRIDQPGVKVVESAPAATVNPGQAVALTTRVTVRCTAADLPRSPSGVTLTVRTASFRGQPPGDPAEVPLKFDAKADDALPDSGQSQNYLIGSYVTGNFYHLCGSVLTRMPQGITAKNPSTDASPQNPVVRYTLHIAGVTGAEQQVAAPATPTLLPGITSQTDLQGTRKIGPGGVDVVVTDRITDCTAFGDYLAIRDGASTATLWLSYAAPVSVQPVDQRFRTAQAPDVAFEAFEAFDTMTGQDEAFQDALLGQIAAACPNL